MKIKKMNPTSFDPRPYLYVMFGLSSASIQWFFWCIPVQTRPYEGARRHVKEAVRGATRGSPNSLAYSRSFWCSHLLYSFFGYFGSRVWAIRIGFYDYLIRSDFM
ncbi:hypothetical protein E1A91_A01G165900v1 [Gossypium mustelinum]|uniref:Uncharacterized protein n=1 Tax=Gossypium mustelinum TaxID=34275 RepID=A0A5D3AFW5_GOSMU|nr:hypothetical protein E1A91_A01G165900v1 [Gossypium mustelinum]